MKQTKLVINVYENVPDSCDSLRSQADHCITIDPANIDNVRSCIDIWHKPRTKIVLDFLEFEVESNSISNN